VSAEEDTLAVVIGLLKSHQFPFMLTGSVAASFHGRPRATHDADLVIDPQPAQRQAFVTELAELFYVDPEGAKTARRHRSQFNVVETRTASKIELIIRKTAPSVTRSSSAAIVDLGFARDVAIVTPEDAILSKLEWARRSGDSERQLADASAVVAVNPVLDRAYIDRWATDLGVSDLWRRIAGP
jgi:hypothetical protein